MATATFHFRASARTGELHKGSLYLKIIHRRRIKVVTTHYHIFPHEWDSAQQCLILPHKKHARYRQLKAIFDNMQTDLQQFEELNLKLEQQGEFSIDDILSQYHLSPPEEMMSSYVQRLSNELVENGKKRTARAYQTVARNFTHFNNDNDLSLKKINPDLIHNYEHYLIDSGKNESTITFYMSNLRAIYYKAIHEEMIHPKYICPFHDIHAKREDMF